jgi:hypothetical protein
MCVGRVTVRKMLPPDGETTKRVLNLRMTQSAVDLTAGLHYHSLTAGRRVFVDH